MDLNQVHIRVKELYTLRFNACKKEYARIDALRRELLQECQDEEMMKTLTSYMLAPADQDQLFAVDSDVELGPGIQDFLAKHQSSLYSGIPVRRSSYILYLLYVILQFLLSLNIVAQTVIISFDSLTNASHNKYIIINVKNVHFSHLFTSRKSSR